MENRDEIKKLTCILAERDKEIEELQKETVNWMSTLAVLKVDLSEKKNKISKLEVELEKYKLRRDAWADDYISHYRQIKTLETFLAQYIEGLRKYGTHKQDCYLNLDDIPVSQKHCSCGFFEVKSLLNKLEGGKHV